MYRSDYGSLTRTRTFSAIFEEINSFQTEFSTTPFSDDFSQSDIELIYYLLLSNFANSHIASSDENRFKLKLFTTIFQYAPTWLKRLELQKKIRNLTDDEILQGAKTINNNAFNPATNPGTGATEELPYINNQTTTSYKKSKIEAYSQIWNLLEVDVTDQFVYQFKKLFMVLVYPEDALLYETEEE